MDKKLAGLLGAAAALTTMTSAQAAPAQPEPSAAASYRDLLDSIPNALPLLKADNQRLAERRTSETTRLAQISVQVGHHHHHHHVRVGHHHHHHHSRHHHHHHHHHHD